ncbi:MAG: hypothetical protein PVI30_07810 [Myxococcales bacterium]|jgi:hypothetical protein
MPWRASALLCVIAAAVGPLPARADEVHLRGGRVLTGKVTRQGGRVIVEIPGGTVSLDAAEVERIEAGDTSMDEVQRRRAALEPDDVEGRLALADYCRDHGLPGREKALLREVLDLQSDHPVARARLGYVRTEAGWVPRDEHMRAQGMVRFEGRWVTRAEMLELERMRAEARRAREQERAAELEVKRRQAEVDQAQTRGSDREEAEGDPATASQAPSTTFVYGYWPPPPAAARRARPGVRCRGERCRGGRRGRARRARRETFPIPHVRDPFDYF